MSDGDAFLMYSMEKSVKAEEATIQASDITCTPNPAASTISFSIPESLSVDRLQITDTQGKVWINGPWSQTIALDGLPTGIYYAGLVSKNKVYWKPFVKQ